MNRKRKSTLSGSSVSKNIKQNNSDFNREYIVERILDRRIRNGKTEYYLKWLGYSSAFNSWEPEDNIVTPKSELNDLNKRFDEEQRIKNKDCGLSFNSLRDSDDEASLSSSNSTNNFKPKNKHKSHKKSNNLNSTSSSNNHNNSTMNSTSSSSISANNNLNKSSKAINRSLNGDQSSESSHDSSYILNVDNSVNKKSAKNHINRLEMNYPVEHIFGATENSNGELMYLVKWKGFNGAELVNGQALEKKQPQVVLNFFRSNFKFK